MQVVHFVRHGEGFHNIGIVNEDAHLTEAGWRQAEALNKHIQQLKPSIDVQVCVGTDCILSAKEDMKGSMNPIG